MVLRASLSKKMHTFREKLTYMGVAWRLYTAGVFLLFTEV